MEEGEIGRGYGVTGGLGGKGGSGSGRCLF